MSIHISKDKDDLASDIAQRSSLAIKQAIAERGVAHVVLAGGSTFLQAYSRLATEAIDWPKVQIYFGDERCVDPAEGRSNYFQIKESLFDRLDQSSLPVVHRIQAELPADKAISQYVSVLPGSFDLVLSGLGSDGHTASLFAGSLAFLRPGAKVIRTEAELAPLVPRITLTPEALNNSRAMLVAASGLEKAEVVAQTINSTKELPIGLLRPLNGLVEWCLDADAASQLS